MKIALGSDHAGFVYKEKISAILKDLGVEVRDHGTTSADSTDYPLYANTVAREVSSGEADWGILVCGTGIGVAITANKVAGIRAANCLTPEMARLAREHNDANVLTIGERLVDPLLLADIIDVFLSTEASTVDRHRRRVEMIHELTGC